MRTELLPRVNGALVALSLTLCFDGCVSSGIRDDLAAVRSFAHVERVADVDGEVDDGVAADVHEVLRRPLDADAAVRIALVNNRELRASLRELGIARGRLMQAGLLSNPFIEAELQPERQTTVEFRVEWDIASLLLAPMRAGAARAALDAERLAAAGAVIALGYEVRDAFYGVLAAEEQLAVAQRQLDALAAARDAARALADAGNLRALDVAVRDAAFEQERIRVAERELSALVAREKVQRLLGLHGVETSWSTTGPLPPVPRDGTEDEHLERRAIEASLELRALQSRMTASARRAGLARAEGVIPELLVDVHALIGDATDTDTGSVAFGAGIGLRLPVFDQGRGLVAEYEAELGAHYERYVGLAIDIRSSARETRARVASARMRARHYAAVVLPARQRVVDQALLQNNAMNLSVFQLLDALRDRQLAEMDAIATRREYWSAAAAREALLAGKRVESAMRTTRGDTNERASAGEH